MQPFQVIDFHVVPSTIGAHQATLIWEKPLHAQAIFGYQLFLDNDLIQTRPTNKTHWTLTNLSADQTYQVTIIRGACLQIPQSRRPFVQRKKVL